MDDSDALLYPLFTYLRRCGVPLGVAEYALALDTLRSGLGLDDPASFKLTCRLLWAKSQEDQQLFDHGFTLLVEPKLRPRLASDSSRVGLGSGTQDLRDTTPSLRPGYADKSKQLDSEESGFRAIPLMPRQPHDDAPETDLPRPIGTYQLQPRLPMTRREMAGAWRHLRRLQREGPPVDLDVQGTIADICRTGFLLRPAMQARRRNQVRLVALIDRYGSMAPFAPLIDALVESIDRGGLLGRTSHYYFQNCPAGFLSPHPGLTDLRPIDQVLAAEGRGSSILIVSDAGAARGAYRAARVACTRDFLDTLSRYSYRYAWLNPLPKDRWESTTAEDVARMVPMFALDRDGLIDIVNILRGHPFPTGVSLDARR